MKAAVLHGKNDLRYEEYPDPRIGRGDVLVKVKATGICGSDIPRVFGDAAHFYPIVLGHEFCGEVVKTGKDVKTIKVGDRCAGAPLLPCLKCDYCCRGNYSQCNSYSFIGSKEQGSFAEYVRLPERNSVKFDSKISFEQGVFFEPSSVALHGIFCANYVGGEDVAILGGGTIGLFTAQWAKIFGAKRIFVFDINEERLSFAKRLVADVTINTCKKDFKELVYDLTNNKGFGFVFDTAGADVTIKLSFKIASAKSSICFIGTPAKDINFPYKLFETINRKELRITGSWMSYSAPFPGKEWLLTADYFASGRLKFDKSFIYKKIPLSEIIKGFELYKNPSKITGKILLMNE